MTTRRNALKLMLGGAASTAALGQSPLQLQFATPSARAAIPGRTLIKVFQRGGADGVNLFPPYGENEYYTIRPNIAVAPPNGGDANSALRLTNFFGMHPAMAPLMEIWDNGDMAVIPAAHFEGASRSHFDNQAWIESGIRGFTASGYLGRYLEQNPPAGLVQALVAGRSSATASMRGTVPVTAVRDQNSFSVEDSLWCRGADCDGDDYHSVLRRLTSAFPSDASALERLAYGNGAVMSDTLDVFQSVDPDALPDAGGLDYSNSNFGRGLRVIANLIKADVGLEVAATDWNIGWDTHSNQLPNGTSHGDLNFGFHGRMNTGASDILTFYRDISAVRNDVTMVIGTEFGRTSRENGSRGTDHGHAAAWMAIGGRVNGGIIGAWPGLQEQQLHNGRFLEQTVNYKDIVSEGLVRLLGTPESQLATIFPDHQVTDLGLFAGAGS